MTETTADVLAEVRGQVGFITLNRPKAINALSLGMVVAMTALEFLVAFLQAFVFTVLTCIYLNDVVNLGEGH